MLVFTRTYKEQSSSGRIGFDSNTDGCSIILPEKSYPYLVAKVIVKPIGRIFD